MSNYSVTPEIVDSHTHLIFGGDRSDEYIQRLNGESYENIAKNGGGINATSVATNNSSIESLIESAKKGSKLFIIMGWAQLKLSLDMD